MNESGVAGDGSAQRADHSFVQRVETVGLLPAWVAAAALGEPAGPGALPLGAGLRKDRCMSGDELSPGDPRGGPADAGRPASRDDRKGWGVATGAGYGILLTIVGLSVMGFLPDSSDGPFPSVSVAVVPLYFAAVPIVVGAVLLTTGRRRNFALGLMVGAGMLLTVDTVACFTLISTD